MRYLLVLGVFSATTLTYAKGKLLDITDENGFRYETMFKFIIVLNFFFILLASIDSNPDRLQSKL